MATIRVIGTTIHDKFKNYMKSVFVFSEISDFFVDFLPSFLICCDSPRHLES